jgi:succinate dehydrogenase / fumarate reductase flavoprotein subunit
MTFLKKTAISISNVVTQAMGNLVPRDVASRAAKERCDAGSVLIIPVGVFLDFKYAIERLGVDVIKARYGNLFQMYEKIPTLIL